VVEEDVEVSVEELFDLYVNGKHYATALLTPVDLEEWTVGFLFSEGLINSAGEVKGITVAEGRIEARVSRQRRALRPPILTRLLVSSCTAPTKLQKVLSYVERVSEEIRKSSLTLTWEAVIGLSAKLNQISGTYRVTRGTHSAALFNAKCEVLAYSEDVGRHNAVDKVVGKALLAGLDTKNKILAVSGRPSGDLVYKCVRALIPVIVALSAPLSSGVEVAEAAGITLVGLARGQRFTVYTNPGRIKLGGGCFRT
jgi:FdhD protein